MELINFTRMTAGYTMGLEPSGRELLVVVIKGTFKIPSEPGARLQLHEEQAPLVMSDVFYGEPGLSAPKYETDYAPRKRQCDILLSGQAYAPGGRPAARVASGIRVGNWSKSLVAVGDRIWYVAGGIRATSPSPFLSMPIHYGHAFGGVDRHHEDPAQHAAYMVNPAGRGFHQHLKAKWLEESPLPNTEEVGAEVTRPDGRYRPMSFGSLGRHWDPRYRYAGTYDQNWLDDVAPFLPADFDEQYYQAAPQDQRLPLPLGERIVSLTNLTPQGRCDFVLPHFEAPVYVFAHKGKREDFTAPVDTILIEPDQERVSMVWRVTRPLRKSLREIRQVLVGRKGPEWWQQREQLAFPIPIIVEPVPPKGIPTAKVAQ